jgi:hypothetical protein
MYLEAPNTFQSPGLHALALVYRLQFVMSLSRHHHYLSPIQHERWVHIEPTGTHVPWFYKNLIQCHGICEYGDVGVVVEEFDFYFAAGQPITSWFISLFELNQRDLAKIPLLFNRTDLGLTLWIHNTIAHHVRNSSVILMQIWPCGWPPPWNREAEYQM